MKGYLDDYQKSNVWHQSFLCTKRWLRLHYQHADSSVNGDSFDVMLCKIGSAWLCGLKLLNPSQPRTPCILTGTSCVCYFDFYLLCSSTLVFPNVIVFFFLWIEKFVLGLETKRFLANWLAIVVGKLDFRYEHYRSVWNSPWFSRTVRCSCLLIIDFHKSH